MTGGTGCEGDLARATRQFRATTSNGGLRTRGYSHANRNCHHGAISQKRLAVTGARTDWLGTAETALMTRFL